MLFTLLKRVLVVSLLFKYLIIFAEIFEARLEDNTYPTSNSFQCSLLTLHISVVLLRILHVGLKSLLESNRIHIIVHEL